MVEDTKKQKIILSIVGIIPVIWLSLLIAPYVDEGLVGIIKNFGKATDNPFNIKFKQFKYCFIFIISVWCSYWYLFFYKKKLS